MRRIFFWGLFWVAAGAFYIWFFGRSVGSAGAILHLALPLLAIAMGTSLVFGRVLLPLLLRGDYVRFGLFAAYTVVVSVYLVLAVIVGAFMMADFSVRNMAPAALDRPALLVGVYLVVATALVIQLFGRWGELQQAYHELHDDNVRTRKQLEAFASPSDEVLELPVERETVRVPVSEIRFLESAGDYVLVATGQRRLIAKLRLTDLAERLASHGFVRVHRSFVVSLAAVGRYSASRVVVGDTEIPVGRTYRPEVRKALADQDADPALKK